MSGETTTTVVGNLTDDPELHHTPVGPVVSFTVAAAARVLDRTSGEWKDGDPLFLRCSLWHTPAEHAAASLHRGARVIVTGRLRQRSFETPGGEKRTVIELAADEVGASLRFGPTRVRLPLRDASNGATPSST
jgi:single-strand DNA-binding protein